MNELNLGPEDLHNSKKWSTQEVSLQKGNLRGQELNFTPAPPISDQMTLLEDNEDLKKPQPYIYQFSSLF